MIQSSVTNTHSKEGSSGTNPWRTWLNWKRNKYAPLQCFLKDRVCTVESKTILNRASTPVSCSLCCYLVVCRGRDSNWNEQGAAKNPLHTCRQRDPSTQPKYAREKFFRARHFTPGPRKTLRWVTGMRSSSLFRAQIHFVGEFHLKKFSKSWCVSSQSWTQSQRSVPLFSGALWWATRDAQTIDEDEILRKWMAKTRRCVSETNKLKS